MGLPIEAIRNSIVGPREELNKPSPLSIRIRESKIPGWVIMADTIERAIFSVLGPINIARIFHEQIGVLRS